MADSPDNPQTDYWPLEGPINGPEMVEGILALADALHEIHGEPPEMYEDEDPEEWLSRWLFPDGDPDTLAEEEAWQRERDAEEPDGELE